MCVCVWGGGGGGGGVGSGAGPQFWKEGAGKQHLNDHCSVFIINLSKTLQKKGDRDPSDPSPKSAHVSRYLYTWCLMAT